MTPGVHIHMEPVDGRRLVIVPALEPREAYRGDSLSKGAEPLERDDDGDRSVGVPYRRACPDAEDGGYPRNDNSHGHSSPAFFRSGKKMTSQSMISPMLSSSYLSPECLRQGSKIQSSPTTSLSPTDEFHSPVTQALRRRSIRKVVSEMNEGGSESPNTGGPRTSRFMLAAEATTVKGLSLSPPGKAFSSPLPQHSGKQMRKSPLGSGLEASSFPLGAVSPVRSSDCESFMHFSAATSAATAADAQPQIAIRSASPLFDGSNVTSSTSLEKLSAVMPAELSSSPPETGPAQSGQVATSGTRSAAEAPATSAPQLVGCAPSA